MMQFIVILMAQIILTSCFQQSNSHTKDSAQVDSSEGVAFQLAFTTLNNECIYCHHHDHWSNYTREADWLTEDGLVIVGSAVDSLLVKRIHGCGGTSVGRQMPESPAEQLTDQECASITSWINSLEQ